MDTQTGPPGQERPPVPTGPDRSHRAAHFFSVINRHKINLRRRWWIVLLGIILALGLEAAWIRFVPPSYFSIGTMIVSLKLTTPQRSTYAEELNTFIGTQTALMESDVVASHARARLIAKNPADQPNGEAQGLGR